MESILTNLKNSKHKHTFPERLKKSFIRLAVLNDLSLDAPLVAIAWQIVIAKSLLASLEFYHHLVLGISVWLCYSADRFFEPSQLAVTSSRRHEIFKRHGIAFLVIWFFLLFLAVIVSLIFLPLDCFLWGIPLFVVSVSNLALCLRESRTGSPFPVFKELRTAAIFALGCFFFPAYESFPGVSQSSMTLAVVFYLLFINCLSTSRWELVNDDRNGSLSFLQRSPKLLSTLSGTPFFAVLVLGLILVSGIGICLEIFLLTHALTILVFVLWLEEVSFLAEDDKRKAIDLGYWILPLFLSGFEHVGLF